MTRIIFSNENLMEEISAMTAGNFELDYPFEVY